MYRAGLIDRQRVDGKVPPAGVGGPVASKPHHGVTAIGFDILAHTSQWEGLPRAVVQAGLMHVPSVAFNIDGTPEVITDGQTGRLVALNDTAGFATALLELAADADTRARMGQAGRAACLERFTWQRMVAELEALYLRLGEQRGRK